jgi:hypothetical protein
MDRDYEMLGLRPGVPLTLVRSVYLRLSADNRRDPERQRAIEAAYHRLLRSANG